MSLAGAVAGGMLALVQGPPAAPTASPEDPTTVESVVVNARRDRSEEEQKQAVEAFVRQLAAPTVRQELARWGDKEKVCPGVVGVSAEKASYLLDRFAEEALAVGLEVGAPGCRPSVLIVVTGRANEFAADFHKKHWKFFAPLSFPGDIEAGGGGQSISEFVTSTRPVRWWHVAKKVRREQHISRFTRQDKDDLSRALVIVDAAQLGKVSYEQLAGYLSMVMLAQLKPEGQPQALSSIMTLFADRDAGRTPPESLTTFDRAYLKGLYAQEGYSSNLHHQQGRLRRSLWKALRPDKSYPG